MGRRRWHELRSLVGKKAPKEAQVQVMEAGVVVQVVARAKMVARAATKKRTDMESMMRAKKNKTSRTRPSGFMYKNMPQNLCQSELISKRASQNVPCRFDRLHT